MIYVAWILGIIFAVALAYFLTSMLVAKSNDAGNSTGTFQDFSRHDIFILEKQDNDSLNKYEKLISRNKRSGNTSRWVTVNKYADDISGACVEKENMTAV